MDEIDRAKASSKIGFFLLVTAFIFSIHPIRADRIDITSYFNLSDIPARLQLPQQTEYEIQLFSNCAWLEPYVDTQYCQDVKKVIVMNNFPRIATLSRIPPEQLVLFLWEPEGASSVYCNLFSRVYTFDDDLVDGKKYHKFYYPYLMPIRNDLLRFHQKALCTLVTRHWTKERMKIVDFFDSKKTGDFDFFGLNPGKYANNPMYRGPIPGFHSGIEKITTLMKYKFCICFENTCIPGYITEKIFSCFAAGCVPIYLGAPNIEEYIPADCFIDYRGFSSDEDLYQFIKTMPIEVYEGYIAHIKAYLQSEKAQLFSSQHFEEILYDAIKN